MYRMRQWLPHDQQLATIHAERLSASMHIDDFDPSMNATRFSNYFQLMSRSIPTLTIPPGIPGVKKPSQIPGGRASFMGRMPGGRALRAYQMPGGRAVAAWVFLAGGGDSAMAPPHN